MTAMTNPGTHIVSSTDTVPSTDTVRRTTLRYLVRLARCLKADVSGIAAAGQLGPDAETEVSRWTGARI